MPLFGSREKVQPMSDDSASGPRIAFFFDYGVTVPLWDEDGLLPDDPEWLQRELGLSRELIADLTAWAELQDLPGHPTGDDDRERHRLLQRLKHEVAPRFTVVECL
jgi:hypothetical protein